MRSRANIAGHPLHPILIAFPIAFLVGALVADAIGYFTDRIVFWEMGGYLNLAAIATGLLAAVPGLIDYFAVIPPNSSAKKRATYHMLVNVVSLGAFAAAWAFRNLESWHPGVGTLVLELAGVLGVTVGGWLGGTLVYRNQIGVDHRYAHAGKWNETEARIADGGTAVVGRADELKVNQMKLVHLDGRRIVVARTEEGYVAFDDHCTHRGGSLADGALACGTVQCPWHGSQFDVRSGTVKAGPAEQPITTYTVVESGGELRLSLTHVVPGSQPRGAAAS